MLKTTPIVEIYSLSYSFVNETFEVYRKATMSLHKPYTKYFSIKPGLSWLDNFTVELYGDHICGNLKWWFNNYPEAFLDGVHEKNKKVARHIYNQFARKVEFRFACNNELIDCTHCNHG